MTESRIGDRIVDALQTADVHEFQKAVVEWLATTGLSAEEKEQLREGEEKGTT